MRVLVTGHQGRIGTVIAAMLEAEGHTVAGLDRKSGDNLLNAPSLQHAAQGCEAIIHTAAVFGGSKAEQIMNVNLLGTWYVLCAAETVGVERVVYFSSVNAMGIFSGEAAPTYLPIDDQHPCMPTTPYGISKLLAEQMCGLFTHRTGIATVCLRPPAVWDAASYRAIREARRQNPEFEWSPYWEYGAFVDVRDAARAALCGLGCPDPGHATVLLCAEDISSADKTSRELVEQIHPNIPWRGGPEYEAEPYRALLKTDRAREILGWCPGHRWR